MHTPIGLAFAALLALGPAMTPAASPSSHPATPAPAEDARPALVVAGILADAARRDTPPAGRQGRDEPRREEPRRDEPRKEEPKRRDTPEARPAPRDENPKAGHPRSLGEPELRRRRPT